MPKPNRSQKKKEYSRSRRYHVFTAPAANPTKQGLVGRILLLSVTIALISFAVITVLHRR